jgi:hypothetical protein
MVYGWLAHSTTFKSASLSSALFLADEFRQLNTAKNRSLPLKIAYFWPVFPYFRRVSLIFGGLRPPKIPDPAFIPYN